MSLTEDIIIFTSITIYSLKLIMKTIANYEVLDKLLKKIKSMFMVTTNTIVDIIEINRKKLVLFNGKTYYLFRLSIIHWEEKCDILF